jgi:site-specific recombinase XerD
MHAFKSPRLTIPKDPSGQWYISLWCPDPDNPSTFLRVRKMDDINSLTTYRQKLKRAKYWLDYYGEKLMSGWNPLVVEAKDPLRKKKSAFTLSYSINLYLKEKNHSVGKKSFHKYKYFMEGFLDWMKEQNLDTISIASVDIRHILDYRNTKLENHIWGNKNSNTFISCCTTFFRYLVDNYDYVITKNPIKGVKKLNISVKGNKAYTEDQIANLKKLMLKNNPYLYFYCQTIYNTCTRPQAETRLLKCGDFDFNRKVLCIRSEISKCSVTQYIPLSDSFILLLKKNGIDTALPDYYVFTQNKQPGLKPLHQETLQGWFSKIKTELNMGKEYSLYSWKHTRNIHAWQDTKDIMFIKTLNRHTVLETTMIYLRDLGCFVDNNQIVNKLRQI